MRADVAPRVAQKHDIPDAIRAVNNMAEYDYFDLFTVTASDAGSKTPEQWARSALEGASPTARFVIWQVLCGLRLETRPSPDHVAGWKIADRGVDWIRLEAASWFMTAHAVVRVEAEQLSVALFVRYDRSIGEFIWTGLSIGHRYAMPGLLVNAVRRIDRSPEVAT